MAFDPDKYLADEGTPQGSTFDPDAYLAKQEPLQALKPTPQQIERMVGPPVSSVTAPITGEGGAAFGMYPKVSAKEPVVAAPSLTDAQPAKPRDFSAVDAALEKLTPKPKAQAFPVMTESDKLFGPMPKPIQPMGGRNIGLTPEKAAESPEIVALSREYWDMRYPNLQKPKSDVELMAAINEKSQTRTYGKVAQRVWLDNATPRQREVDAKISQIQDKMPKDVLNTVALEGTDPINWFGAGAGKIAREALLKAQVSLIKVRVGTTAATATTEGAVSGYKNLNEQNIAIARGFKDSIDYGELALTVGASALFEGVATGLVVGKDIKLNSEKLAEFKAANPPEALDAATVKFKEEFMKREKGITDPLYESVEARQAARDATFGETVPMDDPYQAVMSKPIVDDIFKITKQLFVDNPDLRFKLEEVKTVDNIVKILGDTQPEQLQQAAARAGVSPEKFLEMFKVQASEAGAFLQKNSEMSKVMRGMFKGDPELEKAFKRMLDVSAGRDTYIEDALTSIKNVTGASVGTMTAGLATTVPNAIGLVGSTVIKTAGDTLEAIIKASSRMGNDLLGGEIPIKDVLSIARIRDEISQVFEDSTFLIQTMWDGGWSAQMAEMAAKNSPRTAALLNSLSTEYDLKGKGRINDFARTVNVLNRAVDATIRGPVYLQALKDRMRDVGLDYKKFLANDTPIPVALDKLAAEDAMKMTFSYSFKKGTGGVEGIFEDSAYELLKFIDNNTAAGITKDLLFPFTRFTLNLVRFTYRLTPISDIPWQEVTLANTAIRGKNVASSALKKVGIGEGTQSKTIPTGGGYGMLKRAAKLREEGKLEEAARLSYDGRSKIRDEVIGTALIFGTMVHQNYDPDVPFHQDRDSDGNLIDVSGIVPYVQIRALGAAMNVAIELGKDYMYSLTYTPEERLAEAKELKSKADLLDKNDPERAQLLRAYELMAFGSARNFDGQKFTEVMTGMGRASLSQDTIIDRVKGWIEDGVKTSAAQKAGQVVGDFAGRFDNFANPFYDMYNAIAGQTEIKDPKATQPGKEESWPFFAQVLRTIKAPTPFRGDLQNKEDLFQPMTMRTDPLARNLFGLRSTPPTTALKNEFERIGVPPYSVLKTTGNRDLDNMLVKVAAPEFRAYMADVISSEDYKAKSNEEKEDKLRTEANNILSKFKKEARDQYFSKYGQSAIDAAYEKAPKKKAQERAFIRVEGREPTTNADKFDIIEGAYIDIGVVGNAINQTADMLSKGR
jgi:hypothetical protein